MELTSLIGWAGMAILTFSAVPQLHITLATKTIEGLSLGMLLMWVSGMSLMLVYSILQDLPFILQCNYAINLLIEAYILRLYLKFRNN